MFDEAGIPKKSRSEVESILTHLVENYSRENGVSFDIDTVLHVLNRLLLKKIEDNILCRLGHLSPHDILTMTALLESALEPEPPKAKSRRKRKKTETSNN